MGESCEFRGHLDTFPSSPPLGRPRATTHALHVLQQLASGEGRPVPVQEAQLLLSLTAATNALPTNTLVQGKWHEATLSCPTGTYRPPPKKRCSMCTWANRRQPTLSSRSQTHRLHSSLPHSTRQTPHSHRVLPRAPSPTPLLPAIQVPAVQPPACQNNPPQRARSPDKCPMQTVCHQNPLTPLPPVLWTRCRDHACKQPWLVLTLSLPRMFCCSLVTCSAARQHFAKHTVSTCTGIEGAETAIARQVHGILPRRLGQLVACRLRRGRRGRPAQRPTQRRHCQAS